MANQVVKIRSAEIASCMKCPLCDRLYREATTISECLHTFCKKCIYKKLSDDEDDCCPVCNTYLGCSPLEKLRSDHNKKDLREKVFPSKKSQGETSKVEPPAVETPKVETPKVEPPVVETPMVETPEVLPVRRKERSLSSLVVSTPRVSTKTPLTGRRSKVPTRKTPGKAIKKEEEDSSEDHSDSSSNTRQNSSPVEPDKETVKSVEKCEGKADLWDPLTCLVEAANRSKSSKITPVGSAEKSDLQKGAANNDRPAPKTKGKEHGQSSKVQDEKNGTEPAPVETSNPQKLRRNRRKKSAEASGESAVSPQNVMDGCAEVLRERKIPMWLSLIAYEDQDGNEPLAQIAPAYIRVKDADIPVSSLQKYLMIKLGLKSAEEVEIKCMGQPLIPTLQLNSLLELWLQTGAPTEKVPVQVGSTGKEFVMVLSYGRKVPPP